MPQSVHPFDRYAQLTDLVELNRFSALPLRKSIRANTLKMSAEELKRRAEQKNWQLTRVPWCPEAFFVEREDRSVAVGRDLLHLMGHFYMQEAASMLPVALLQPQPGETILDMSAAPGSKTTQLAARMGNTGVIVANDVQEKRLWTLKSAIYRLGVTNAVVTKKVGQWFGKHMTERFDRVLCDAPCTAQGTARKDSDALMYCSLENIEKMSRLQFALLEAAIHATKVGGRVVYSTCTLTPEENEMLIGGILRRFEGQIEIVDPRELDIATDGYWDKAIDDAHRVQRASGVPEFPCLRLWPQTYDTEGFFCAVLRKTAPTRDVTPMEMMRFQEEEMPAARLRDIARFIESHYGAALIDANERLFLRSDQLLLSTDEVSKFRLPVQNYALGMPFAKKLPDGRVLLSHEAATLRGGRATEHTYTLSAAQVETLLEGKDVECPADLQGHLVLMFDGICIGHSLAKDGRLKNNLPRWLMQV